MFVCDQHAGGGNRLSHEAEDSSSRSLDSLQSVSMRCPAQPCNDAISGCTFETLPSLVAIFGKDDRLVNAQ